MKKNFTSKTFDSKLYAEVLFVGSIAVFILLTLTFFLLLFDIMESHVPLRNTYQNWHLPCKQFVEATGKKTGWLWLADIWKSDHLSYLGIALLALLTCLAYIRVLPYFLRKKDFWFTLICIAEIVLITLVASGILHSAGH